MPISPVSYVNRPYVRDGSLGEILRMRGRDQSEAILRSGEIQARMWSDLGQTIAGGIQGYARERQEAPIRAQRLETERQQNELGRLQIAGTKQATEDKSTLASAHGSGMAPDAVKAQLSKLGRGDLIPVYEQAHTALETSRLGLREQRVKMDALETDYMGGLAATVKKAKYDPLAIEWALGEADADGYDTKSIRHHLQRNPQGLPQFIDGLIEKSPTQRRLMGEEADRELSQTREERVLTSAQQLQADREADNRRAETAAVALERDREADNRRADATARAAAARSGDTEPLMQIVGPDGKAVYVRRRDAVGKTPGAGTEKSSSGVQKRVLNFFNRAEQADKDLEALEPEIERLNLSGQAWQAVAPNFAQTQLGQSYTAAQRAFTEARLRKDSGAAIPPHEFKSDRETYFVQPGDSKKTIQDKNRARAAMLASLAFESGQALGEFIGDADEARAVVDGYKARAGGQSRSGVTVTAPDGSKHSFATQAEADNFKRLVGLR